MSLELNVFNQYNQAENRLTHALGVTLQRSRSFQAVFLKELAGGTRLRRKTNITLQLSGGWAEYNGEKCGIPDLAIIDDKGHAIIIEAKLGAGLAYPQLASHENRADRNDLKVIAALAITGRDKDREALAGWVRDKRLRHAWHHVSWQEVYRLVCRLADKFGEVNQWLPELRDYMQIMAASLDEKEMGADVKIIDFTGVSEEMVENYTPAIAKRVLRSLMDELRGDKQFLGEIGISGEQPPRKRKAIKNSVRVWDFLSPVGDADNFTKSHHFTMGLHPDRIEAYLTIPNASFRKFKNYAQSVSAEEFATLIDRFTEALKKKGVMKAGGRPFIVLVQRRFKNMTQYAEDGRMEFDLRTWTGSKHANKEPEIKQQREWLEFCHRLVTERDSNIQFQLGTRFYFDTSVALQTKDSINLFKDTFRAVMPVVSATGYI